MTRFELEALIQQKMKARVDDLTSQIAVARAARDEAQTAADNAAVGEGVAAVAAKTGWFRQGAEAQLIQLARADGWRNVVGHLLQVDEQGNVIGRDLEAWFTAKRGEMVALLSPQAVCVSDQREFEANLDKIASGEIEATPLARGRSTP